MLRDLPLRAEFRPRRTVIGAQKDFCLTDVPELCHGVMISNTGIGGHSQFALEITCACSQAVSCCYSLQA